MRVAASCSLVLIVLSAIALWWFTPVALPPYPTAVASDQSSSSAENQIAKTADTPPWAVTLWRPLTDAPISEESAEAPKSKLFSILKQGDETIAAFESADGGLVYVQKGDKINGSTVTSINDTSVVLSTNGQTQRVDIPR
jgi:type IV pilus biogenesis protein PilP